MTPKILTIETPSWALPLLRPCRYKGIRGGRGSGKSHTVAEILIEESYVNPDLQTVCVREIQKSLSLSSKKVLEEKIRSLGLSDFFEITRTEIRRKGGEGLFIFQGMQDHTADSIKSLEGFDRAWVEEAQSLSARSLELLTPTIRKEGSEIYFTWNPESKNDPVDRFFQPDMLDERKILINVNYDQNPFLPRTLYEEMLMCRRTESPEKFRHIWLGEYNTVSEKLVFRGKWRIGEMAIGEETPFFGMDFGFAQDPTAVVKVYILGRTLYVSQEAGKVGLELDATAEFVKQRIAGIEKYVIRADSSRPESISYLKRNGLPRIEGVKKWANSVEEGIAHMRSFDEIVIHPSCKQTIEEFSTYSHKMNKHTGDILPDIEDKNNHFIDAIRYALVPMLRPSQGFMSRR